MITAKRKAMCLLASGMVALSFATVCVGEEAAISRLDQGTECYRPATPEPDYYETAEAYGEAKEGFYREASIYLDCVNRWVEEIQQMYREMLQAEIQSFGRERDAVFDDLKRVAKTQYRGRQKNVQEGE